MYFCNESWTGYGLDCDQLTDVKTYLVGRVDLLLEDVDVRVHPLLGLVERGRQVDDVTELANPHNFCLQDHLIHRMAFLRNVVPSQALGKMQSVLVCLQGKVDGVWTGNQQEIMSCLPGL